MQSGIKLGRLFGIRIILDWSWLVILFLVTWNLAGSYFPSMHPDWSPGLRWGTGLAASLLFFVSILAHELAHSLAAKASGLEVHQIRLFLFGGVSNIEREPATPKADFWISFVGPLTSFLLGAAFLGAGLLGLERPGSDVNPILVLAQMDPFQTLLFWLGPVNLLLAVFNLIPGFPLDGGRVLRSVIWAVTRNFSLATQWAARFGQVVAWLFILAKTAERLSADAIGARGARGWGFASLQRPVAIQATRNPRWIGLRTIGVGAQHITRHCMHCQSGRLRMVNRQRGGQCGKRCDGSFSGYG